VIDPTTGLPVASGGKKNPALYVLEASPESLGKPAIQVEAFNLAGYAASLFANDAKDTPKDRERQAELMDRYRRTSSPSSNRERCSNTIEINPRARSRKSPILQFHAGANLVIIMGRARVGRDRRQGGRRAAGHSVRWAVRIRR
jgi:hypothetical protein